MKPRGMRYLIVLAAIGVCCIVLFGCQSAFDKVVVDQLVVLKDGESRIWKMDPGSYKIELTASDDGAAVKWVGANCLDSGQVKSLSTTCKFDQTGQMVVENPTAFGMGASVSVTVKLTRLGRDL